MPSVSEPATLDEASEVLGSGQRVSIEREGGDVRLSTAKLTRVLEHEPGDLTMIVEAGIRLSELQAFLAEHGQMLALDPPGDPTIGACLAGDLSGPRRHRYGAMRDLVIGVTVVLAGGMVASSGGKVVKNVAGYDLGKLFSGSRGRLGLIARVALRVHPRPPSQATVVATGDPRELWDEIRRSQLEPSAVDLLPPSRLALLFEGGEAAVEAQVAACPGEAAETAVWDESARLQGAAGGREAFGWQDCVLARPGPGIAYVEAVAEQSWSPLAERVRASFDPEGILA
ncbi:MAG TPA: FAD-binding oxidoreductase [Gaiellaceae bacterium]|nr:FAD-binding oxidoreductase [Gaiellaceae bacterium]